MHTVILGMHILEGIIKNIVVYDIKKPIKIFFLRKKKLNPDSRASGDLPWSFGHDIFVDIITYYVL